MSQHFLGGGGNGLLPGGGSWTAMVPPPGRLALPTAAGGGGRATVGTAGGADITLVVEKLEGDCLRCKVRGGDELYARENCTHGKNSVRN